MEYITGMDETSSASPSKRRKPIATSPLRRRIHAKVVRELNLDSDGLLNVLLAGAKLISSFADVSECNFLDLN
jgi:hypothetical protein